MDSFEVAFPFTEYYAKAMGVIWDEWRQSRGEDFHLDMLRCGQSRQAGLASGFFCFVFPYFCVILFRFQFDMLKKIKEVLWRES